MNNQIILGVLASGRGSDLHLSLMRLKMVRLKQK